MAVLGYDLAPIAQGVTASLSALRDATSQAQQPQQDYTKLLRDVGTPQPFSGDSWQAITNQHQAAPSSFGGDAWQTLAVAAQQYGGGSGLGGDAWNSLGGMTSWVTQQKAQQTANAAAAAANKPATGPQTIGRAAADAPGTPGAGWGQPTADQLEQELAGSPLQGYGGMIADLARRNGVPVTVVMGILRQESQYGRLSQGFNYGGLKNADGNGFAAFSNAGEGLNAVIGNMGTPLYQGKSIEQFMNTYAPPHENDTTTYINNILALDHKWGGTAGWGTVVSGAPVAPQAGPAGGGIAGYTFPVAGFAGKLELHHGTSSGAADLFAPRGTAVLALRGGTVIDAGYNSLGGNTVTIRGDDGLVVYYAHLDRPANVQAGQAVATGTAIGVVGDSGNAAGTGTHLHIGIGREIQSGAGAEGGAGTPWGTGPQQNANGLLTWILNGGR